MDEDNNQAVLSLACELAVIPEVYDILEESMAEVHRDNDDVDVGSTNEVHQEQVDQILLSHSDILNWQATS